MTRLQQFLIVSDTREMLLRARGIPVPKGRIEFSEECDPSLDALGLQLPFPNTLPSTDTIKDDYGDFGDVEVFPVYGRKATSIHSR
jgi:hypothetical protein